MSEQDYRTPEQFIRTSALNQAVEVTKEFKGLPEKKEGKTKTILWLAEKFEDYIKNGRGEQK